MDKCEICGTYVHDGYLANDLARILGRDPEYDENDFFVCSDCLRNIDDAVSEAWKRKSLGDFKVEPCACGAPIHFLHMRVSVMHGWSVECGRCDRKGPPSKSSEGDAIRLWNNSRKENNDAGRTNEK